MGQLKEFPADRARARDQGRHVWPDQRHDRLRPEADDEPGADRSGPEDLQRGPGHQDGGERLHGCPHPAQLAHGPSRRRGLAGLRRLRLRHRRHRHRHQPGGQHGRERRRGRERTQGRGRHVRPAGHDSLVRALPYRRAGRGGRALSGHGRHDVPEPRRHGRLQQDLRRHDCQDPEVRPVEAGRTLRALLRDRPGLGVHQWRRQRRRHDGARVPQVRLQPGRRRRARQGPAERRLAPCQRCRRVHRAGGVQGPRAAGAVLPGGHRHGQAARPAHRPGRLLDAAHEREPGGSGLVPGAGHAGQPGLPDRVADQERSDAGLSHDLVPGPCPPAGTVRLQGRRCDVVVLPAARDRRSGRQVYRALRRSPLGLLPVPAGQERPRGPRTPSTRKAGEDAGGRGARRRPRDRSRRADLGPQPAARGQGQRALRRCKDLPLGRAHPRVHRVHPRCPAAAHPVRRPQRLHRPSGHRRDVEPGIAGGAGKLAGIVGQRPAQGPDRHLRRPERQGDHGPGASWRRTWRRCGACSPTPTCR